MERSGFFNALKVNGEYDRKYNANDYTDNLAVVIGNGVLRGVADDLRVTASGRAVTVGTGRAWINGHYYYNDTALPFAAVTAPAGGTRWDRVMLRLNSEVGTRNIALRYVQGEAGNAPQKPAPVRSGDVYELVLADVFVGTNATIVQVTDTRGDADLCGWVYSTRGNEAFFQTLDNSFGEWFAEKKDTLASVTLFKRYEWRTVLETAGTTAVFNIPQYDEENCILDVFVNGFRVIDGDDYTRSGSVLTFANTLAAGTEVAVTVYKSIDGTGIMSVADEITQLQNDMALLTNTSEYNYVCNGVDDNVKLSQIAQAWLDGGDDYGCKTIRVHGQFGARAAVSGSGATSNPYCWLNVGSDAEKKRRIVFDFSCCGQITLPISAGATHFIFGGTAAHIIGANVVAEQPATDTIIRVFSERAKKVLAEKCRFWISGNKNSMVANHGTFVDCYANIANATGNSYCFLPYSNTVLRVFRGEYYSYTGGSSAQSSIVGHSSANAAAIFDSVCAPTVARSGYYQTNSLLQWAGAGLLSCTDLVSALPMIVVSGSSDIRGTIPYSISGTV